MYPDLQYPPSSSVSKIVLKHRRTGRPSTLCNELRRISKPILDKGLILSGWEVPETLSDNYQVHLKRKVPRPANNLFVLESLVRHRNL